MIPPPTIVQKLIILYPILSLYVPSRNLSNDCKVRLMNICRCILLIAAGISGRLIFEVIGVR